MIVYYCEKCNSLYGYENGKRVCDICGGEVLSTGVRVEEWNYMNEAQQRKAFEYAKNKSTAQFDSVLSKKRKKKNEKVMLLLLCGIIATLIVIGIIAMAIKHFSNSKDKTSSMASPSTRTSNEKIVDEADMGSAEATEKDDVFSFYSECSAIPTVDSVVDGAVCEAKYPNYEYFFGNTSDIAEARFKLYAAVLLSIDGVKLEDSGYANTYKIMYNGRCVAAMGMAKDEYIEKYTLILGFMD